MDALQIFAKRTKDLRESRGMGIRQLATELSISHSSIIQYENCNRTPSIEVCKLFADYFNTTCDYLIGLTDNPKK